MLPIISEGYTDIKARTQAAYLKLSEIQKLNIAAIAQEHGVSRGCFRAHVAGRRFGSQRLVANKHSIGTSCLEEEYSLETNGKNLRWLSTFEINFLCKSSAELVFR